MEDQPPSVIVSRSKTSNLGAQTKAVRSRPIPVRCVRYISPYRRSRRIDVTVKIHFFAILHLRVVEVVIIGTVMA
jgi:hypothetical protein